MRQAQEREFHSFDQVPLFYRYWAGTTATPATQAIVLLHRGHEHSGRVTHLVDELDLPDTAFFAWDARGNGRSPGARGDAPGFPALVRDLDSFIAHIGAEHGIAVEDIVVIAQSVGAVVAATWVHDYAPRLRALVMASPAFKVKLYVPLARPTYLAYALVSVSYHWNNFLWPLIITNSVESRPLTVGLQVFASTDQGIDWSIITAATLLTTAPLLIAFLLFQRQFVQSFMRAGIR